MLKRLWEQSADINFRQRSKVFGNSSEIFGSRRDVSGNLGRDKVKSQVFDSEKVGRYNIAM